MSCLLRTFMVKFIYIYNIIIIYLFEKYIIKGGFLFLIIPLLAATKTVPEDFDITKPNALK